MNIAKTNIPALIQVTSVMMVGLGALSAVIVGGAPDSMDNDRTFLKFSSILAFIISYVTLALFNIELDMVKTSANVLDFLFFSQVSPARPKNKSHDKVRGGSQGHGSGGLAKPLHYHVEGEINSVHSEILMNTICTNHCTHNPRDK